MQQSKEMNARRGAGITPRTGVKRRTLAVGVLTTLVLGVSAQASLAAPTTAVGVANNIFPALKDMRTDLEGDGPFDPITAGAAGQVGGFWNKPAIDTTLMRGITSGNLRMQLKGAGPYTGCDPSTSNNCVNGPLGFVDAFFSADKSNADQVRDSSQTPAGTCTASGSVTCPGTGPEYPAAIGYLAIYSCKSAWASVGDDPTNGGSPPLAFAPDANGSGNGKPASPRCQASPITPAVTTMSDVITYIQGSGHRVAIALPSSAPFGAAAKAALQQAGAAHSPTFTYDDSSGTGSQNAFVGSTCDSMGTQCKIRLESGISQVRGAVTANAFNNTPLGLVALGNVKHITWVGTHTGLAATSDDPNQWTKVAESAYTPTLGDRIKEFATPIKRSPTRNTTVEASWSNILTDGVWKSGNYPTILTTYGFSAP